jgi:hypothetical protein
MLQRYDVLPALFHYDVDGDPKTRTRSIRLVTDLYQETGTIIAAYNLRKSQLIFPEWYIKADSIEYTFKLAAVVACSTVRDSRRSTL